MPNLDDAAVRALAAGRFAVGGGALLAPRLTGRAFAIPADQDGPSIYLARLFGVRAVSMAMLALVARGEDRRRQLGAGVAVDLVDAAAAFSAGRAGQLRPWASAACCAAALVEAGLGVAALTGGRVNEGTARSRS